MIKEKCNFIKKHEHLTPAQIPDLPPRNEITPEEEEKNLKLCWSGLRPKDQLA